MIIYLHGFNSSPDSFKATLVKNRLAELGRGQEFLCPKLPWRFSHATALIDATLRGLTDQPVCLIGSSLGGFYATYFAEKFVVPAVMVNPAARAHISLDKYLGSQRNLYTGEEYVLEARHIDELVAIDVPRITKPERYMLLTQTGDEVLDYHDGVEKFAGCESVVVQGGDHAFRDFAFYVDKVIAFADGHATNGIILKT
jgi:predicted esterase YcpF (UPF0227 family)